jgi:hypothetical protein
MNLPEITYMQIPRIRFDSSVERLQNEGNVVFNPLIRDGICHTFLIKAEEVSSHATRILGTNVTERDPGGSD